MAVKLRPEQLMQFGFRPVEVLDAIQTAYQGTVVAQSYHGNRVSDVSAILAKEFRRDPEGLRSLELRSAQGVRLRLNDVADVYATSGRHSIMHEGARRRQTVTCNPEGVDVATLPPKRRRPWPPRFIFPPAFTANSQRRGPSQTGGAETAAVAFGPWRARAFYCC
jgi:Cu/Ag efflux pump CusA